jgi:hypothetical protein
MVGAAYHNLFTVEMESGRVELAQELAARAFEAYSHNPTSPCLLRLARDLAHRWTKEYAVGPRWPAVEPYLRELASARADGRTLEQLAASEPWLTHEALTLRRPA